MNRMQPLSRPELLAVLKIARANSVRDHALLLLCFAHGMRASECGQLLLADISTKDWTVRIKRVRAHWRHCRSYRPTPSGCLMSGVYSRNGWHCA